MIYSNSPSCCVESAAERRGSHRFYDVLVKVLYEYIVVLEAKRFEPERCTRTVDSRHQIPDQKIKHFIGCKPRSAT